MANMGAMPSRRGLLTWLFHSSAAFALLGGPMVAGCAALDAGARPPSQIVAPTGSLRAALYPGTPTSILNPTSTTPTRGVGYDLGRELARRLGVPYQPMVFAKNSEVLDAIKSGAADVAFTNASAERAQEMDFTQPYLNLELGYLVAAGRPIASLSDIDRAGQRIGVTAHSSSDGVLSKTFKLAQVVRAPTVGVGVDMLAGGQIDAYATNKATLYEMAETLPGATILDGHWGLERHAIAIPKGRGQALGFLNDFVAEVKASGFVQQSALKAGLRGTIKDE